jgi:transposase
VASCSGRGEHSGQRRDADHPYRAELFKATHRPQSGLQPAKTDFHAEELRLLDTDLGQAGLGRPEVLHLMSVPGIDATVALSIVAAIGDFTRFRTPEKLGRVPWIS